MLRKKVTTMRLHTNQVTLPDWLLNRIISGAEQGDPDGSQGDSGEGQRGSEDPPQGDDPAGDAGDPDDEDDPDDKAELKKALSKERKERKDRDRAARKAERELARLRQEAEDSKTAEKGEAAAEKVKRERAEARLEKLVTGYRKSALDSAIEKAARAAKFIDTDDAIAGVDRSGISVEQDEDDPADVTIDTKTVERAVKELATRKRHLVQGGTSDGEPSGSRFGGAGGKGDKAKTDDERIKALYPSLR